MQLGYKSNLYRRVTYKHSELKNATLTFIKNLLYHLGICILKNISRNLIFDAFIRLKE